MTNRSMDGYIKQGKGVTGNLFHVILANA